MVKSTIRTTFRPFKTYSASKPPKLESAVTQCPRKHTQSDPYLSTSLPMSSLGTAS